MIFQSGRDEPTGEIAARTRWSQATVKKYVQRLFATLGVVDRTQAVAEALRRRLIE
jgi:DNA-binding NarL/FixJ family response regulator